MKHYQEDKLQSDTISFLRFPLAIAVIFIHINPATTNLLETDFNVLSDRGIYNIAGIIFSHVLSNIAVPIFYIVSGFLFFNNFKVWNWNQYKRKLQSRTKTLIIPYIVWNVTSWLLYISAYFAKGLLVDNSYSELKEYFSQYNINILYNCYDWGGTRINWLGKNLFMTGPFDFPLWFLRDLIFMVLLTPIIYFLIKKLNLWYILILFLAYISRIWTLIPGLNITSCFFFSLGAYFALNNINITRFARQYYYIICPISIILLPVCVIYDGNNTIAGQNIYPFFIIATVFATFAIASYIVERFNIKPSKLLISSCFFIYAFHAVNLPGIGSPLGASNKLLNYILPDLPYITYFIAPLLATGICIVVMQIGKKIAPGIIKYYTGNR